MVSGPGAGRRGTRDHVGNHRGAREAEGRRRGCCRAGRGSCVEWPSWSNLHGLAPLCAWALVPGIRPQRTEAEGQVEEVGFWTR